MNITSRSSVLVSILFFTLFLIPPTLAFAAFADESRDLPRLADNHDGILQGGAMGSAARDTVLLMGPWGSGALFNGQFEQTDGAASWNQWTHVDLTQATESAWHVSTYNAENLNGHGAGNQAAWCGSLGFEPCSEFDPEGGYGNNYDERLEWVGTVANSSSACEVTVQGWLNYELEPGYDYVSLLVALDKSHGIQIWTTDGIAANQPIHQVFTVNPASYRGENNDEIHLRFLVESDGAWSDEDCSFYGAGACQLDDLAVTLSNGGYTTFDDFEDGALGNWHVGYPQSAGDFAFLRSGLRDLDPCRVNLSPQATFIDDGVVVPGTGGSPCITACYGPGGYIVSPTGGLANDYWASPVHNAIVSPVLPIPEGKEGLRLAFDVYVHEDLHYPSPGIFYTWNVRSTASTDPSDLDEAEWFDRALLYYGGPVYRNVDEIVSAVLVPGARFVQVRLEVIHVVYIWAWCPCLDGSPAPYFDNVRVLSYDVETPSITAYSQDMAQDRFPASGSLDWDDLGANSVRFDRADSLADAVKISARALSEGATLTGPPRMHYRVKTNPLFDSYRVSGYETSGMIDGAPDSLDSVDFNFDLPDTGFLFPGDVVHYYFEATDELNGSTRSATLPADTTGFSDFDNELGYPALFTCRALPSLHWTGEEYTSPEILIWDNSGDEAFRNEWKYAMHQLGAVAGADYDVLTSTDPSQATGNGLGAIATADHLAPYRILALSAGEIDVRGLGFAGSNCETSDDVGRLDEWLRLGGRGLLLTGDRLAQNLEPGTINDDFLEYWAGVSYEALDVRALIGSQFTPTIGVEPGGLVLPESLAWHLNDICPLVAKMNAIAVAGSGQRIAQYTDPDDQLGQYFYAAGAWNEVAAYDARIAFLPYDLARIGTLRDGAKIGQSPATRALVLGRILEAFGHSTGGGPVPVPDAIGKFAMNCYPNPFNPTTQIEFSLPRAAHLELRIFNLRGELVRTLIDEPRSAGPDVVLWNGRDDQAARVASGTYFYRARYDGESRIGKMLLLK